MNYNPWPLRILLMLFLFVLLLLGHEWVSNEDSLAKVLANQQITNRSLADLLEQRAKGPRHTACDTKLILEDLRSRGIALPRYEVEERCRGNQ